MWGMLRISMLALAAASAQAEPLTYEPVGLGWSAAEVESAAAASVESIMQRAEREHQSGCRRHCERLERLFARLVVVARTQSPRARSLHWSLTVLQLPDLEAMALPGGQVLIGEPFVDRRTRSDEALAFVLAHEMAHSILEHERQALTFARMLLPRHVPRSVRDVYSELDFNFGLLKSMEWVLQQGEFEADELGLLLAATAGFAPERQLDFITSAAAEDDASPPLVATHPAINARLEALRARLPLAQRLWAASQD